MSPSQIMLFWSLGGLATFFVLALLPWVHLGLIGYLRDFSALILAFLSGTLWLPAVRDADNRLPHAANLAMAIFLVAWVAFFVPAWLGLLLLMIGYPLLWWLERQWFGSAQSLDYRNLRSLLTWGVVAAHILALASLSRGTP